MKITPETQDYLPFRIAGILILNNGDHPYILQTVRSIEHQLDDLIVIDNATTDQTFKAFTRLRTVLDTETVFFDDQQPITECINIAMHRLPEATDWVTWFTPNSIFHPEFVATLQEKITKASKKEKTQPGLIIAGATTFQEEDPQNLQSYWPPRTDRQTTWDQSFLASYQTLVEAGPHRPEASRLC